MPRIGGPGIWNLGRNIYRQITAKSKMQWGGYDGGLNPDLWEEYSTELIEAQIEKAGNAGQETLLGDDYFRKHAIDFCETVSDEYDDRAFVNYMEAELGDEYYNAINEIIDECSQELYEAWDAAYSNDGVGEESYADFSLSERTYPTFSQAQSAYVARANARFGSYGSPAHLAAKRKTIVNFLKANPNGASRTTPSTPFAGRTAAQRSAVGRKTATQFLKQNPTGIKRTGF